MPSVILLEPLLAFWLTKRSVSYDLVRKMRHRSAVEAYLSLLQDAQALDDNLCSFDARFHISRANDGLNGSRHLVLGDGTKVRMSFNNTLMELLLESDFAEESVVDDGGQKIGGHAWNLLARASSERQDTHQSCPRDHTNAV